MRREGEKVRGRKGEGEIRRGGDDVTSIESPPGRGLGWVFQAQNAELRSKNQKRKSPGRVLGWVFQAKSLNFRNFLNIPENPHNITSPDLSDIFP
jgi:hypothetical protein